MPLPNTRSPSHTALIFLFSFTLIVALSALIANILRFYFNIYDPKTYLFFYSDGENNLTSWFSACVLFLTSSQLFWMGLKRKQAKDSNFISWIFLAVVFFYLSMDEQLALHEWGTIYMAKYAPSTGYFRFGWVLIGIPFVVVFFLSCIKLLIQIPQQISTAFIRGGAIFVTGALGLEMVGANYMSVFGADFFYHLLSIAEEGCETSGVIIFLGGVLQYLENPTTEQGRLPLLFPALRRNAATLIIITLTPALCLEIAKPRYPEEMIEAESLLSPNSNAQCEARQITDKNNGGAWSKGSFLHCKAKPDTTVVFSLPVTPGKYRVQLFLARYTKFGKVGISFGGPEEVYDLFHGGNIYTPALPITMNNIDLTEPMMKLTLHPGKWIDPAEVRMGIDGVVLKRIN